MKIASRVNRVPPSGIRRFFDILAKMRDVVSLGVGEPDFATPWHIREACIYAIEQGYTTYTSNYGILELREEISRYVKDEFGVEYDPEREILVTVGVSEGLDLGIRALVDIGDEVIVHEPSYVAYKPCVVFSEGKVRVAETSPEDEFRLRSEDLEAEITPKTKILILNYPNNPTGATMSKKDLEEIADVVIEHDMFVISDEIYAKLTYNKKHVSIASLNGMRERTLLLNGLSKSFAMTGFRIGYACSNAQLIEAMMKIHQYSMLCASIVAQKAAVEALRHGKRDIQSMVEQYNQRRRFIVRRLNEIGLTCFDPKGAFYAFPSIKITGLTSEKFSERLLSQARVAVVPGNVFGDCGEGFIRCSYATSIEDIEEALERMEGFVRKFL